MSKNCTNCNKEFTKPLNESVRAWNTRHQFCSKTCKYDSMKGKSFYDNTGRKHTEETRRKISESHKGAKAYQWKGGVTTESQKIRASAEYIKWRDAVYKRDRWVCQDCGVKCVKGNIVAHHIISFVDSVGLRFVVENGQVLCRPCHARVHADNLAIARAVRASNVRSQITVA